MASDNFGSNPYSLLTIAAAFFKIPMAVITGYCNGRIKNTFNKRQINEKNCITKSFEIMHQDLNPFQNNSIT